MNRVFFYHPLKKPTLEEMMADFVGHAKQREERIFKTARGKARRHKLPIPQCRADILNMYELLEWRRNKHATVR